MQFTKDDLLNLSKLARVSVTEAEQEKMLHDIQSILSYVSEVNEIKLEGEGVSHTHINVMREDAAFEMIPEKRTIILDNAPETEDSFVKVTQVL